MANEKRLIDANALIERIKFSFYNDEKVRIDTVIETFLTEYCSPTVDAVEVVRCKDYNHITPVEGGLSLCTLHNIAVAYNDFCSYGERKDGAE